MIMTERFWSKEHFPIVYEHNRIKAVMVDIESFEKIELIMDNLIHRDSEPEDNLMAASGLLRKLVSEAETSLPTRNWRAELDEL